MIPQPMIRTWEDIPGWVDNHMIQVYSEAVARAPADRSSLFIEVGVAMGRSLAMMHSLIAASGKPIALIGVDPFIAEDWIQRDLGHAIEAHGGFREACQAYLGAVGCTATLLPLTSIMASRTIASPHFTGADFVFIDADHTCESLTSDLGAWWPLLRAGGTIAGHDHTPSFPGIEQACVKFFASEGGYEVIGSCFRKVKP